MASDQDFQGPGPEHEFRARLADGSFCMQKCDDCGKHIYYPRAVCIHCGGIKLSWVEASGEGTVYSTSVIHQRPEQGENYNVAIIDLKEGPRMMSRVEGIAAADVKIGMNVKARIAEEFDTPFIVFDPA